MVSRIDAIGSGRRKKFLRAYRERESLCAFGALVAWLYRRATQVALDRLRQRARRTPRGAVIDLAEIELPDSDVSPCSKASSGKK